ncbi:AmmeMemoRadiSam system protein B [Azospirillum sp. sgz302134]
MNLRAPAVAGAFYPANPAVLDRMVADCLAEAHTDNLPAKAIIAPHAGYVYSGPIAGTAYAGVAHLGDRVTRVLLLGPAHRYGFRGIAYPSADGLATPLGAVRVDREGIGAIHDLPGVQELDRAFDGEHALEVHLPFIQRLFPRASVVPLIVGHAEPAQVDAVLQRLWGGPETLIVISSDLSHFHDYGTAHRLDLETSQAFEAAEPERLSGDRACGYLPVAGLLMRARALDLRVTTRDLRNSGDTAGDRSRVVGYGAYSVEPATEARLSDAHRELLLETAYRTLAQAVQTGRTPDIRAEDFPFPLRAIRRTFVTLMMDGDLRGCIGTVQAPHPLVEDVATNTVKSAMQDPRFGPLTAAELPRVDISVSILSHDRPLPFRDEEDLIAKLRPGIDGLILRDGRNGALFLPKVWDMLPDPRQFVAQLKRKAGWAPDRPVPGLQATIFGAESFGKE